MATTLKITVHYDSSSGDFSYALSYQSYQDTLADGGTVAFINDGQYTFPGASAITFDTVEVELGCDLRGLSSLQCGSQSAFDLSSIVFPALDGQTSVATPYSWCQQYTKKSEGRPSFKDPKLGLSNTTGDTAVSPPPFGSCACSTGFKLP